MSDKPGNYEAQQAASEAWNTRPQPAPTQGEPERAHKLLARQIRNVAASYHAQNPAGELPDELNQMADEVDRLGFAARPKVEDAEVAELVSKLRDSHREPLLSEQHRAADLLERVALERDQARKEVEQCYAKSTCCCGDYIRGHGTYSGHEPVSMYSYALDAAEDRAAKAEAELAKIHKADIQRVKDISRLTIERDAAREALAERKGGE